MLTRFQMWKPEVLTRCLLLVSFVGAFFPTNLVAGGLESLGNVDGVLTWELDSIEPGESAIETVLFAFADSREDLVALLESARSDLGELPETPAAAEGEASAGNAWIRNASTDFGLSKTGAFLWEGYRQALICARGGQLSRFGYFLHYNTGVKKQAGGFYPRKRDDGEPKNRGTGSCEERD